MKKMQHPETYQIIYNNSYNIDRAKSYGQEAQILNRPILNRPLPCSSSFLLKILISDCQLKSLKFTIFSSPNFSSFSCVIDRREWLLTIIKFILIGAKLNIY